MAFTFASQNDMKIPFSIFTWMQVFLSALIDFAGHAGKVEAAFEILQEAKNQGISVGIISYSSLMGACSNVCLT